MMKQRYTFYKQNKEFLVHEAPDNAKYELFASKNKSTNLKLLLLEEDVKTIFMKSYAASSNNSAQKRPK